MEKVATTHSGPSTSTGPLTNSGPLTTNSSPFFTRERFKRFAWFNLVFTLAVIVWGAFVRATGSGAGCGAHWPLCNGQVLPRPERIQTVIEFAHRSSSGLNLICVVALSLFARKIWPANSRARRAAFLAVVAIFMEAILGAGLVLLKLVEFDQSVARAISTSLHLANTLFLLSALVSTVYFAGLSSPLSSPQRRIFPCSGQFKLTITLFAMLAMMGAIAALGDTLFPATSILHGISQDLESGAHFLVRLRVFHPLLAVAWVFMAFVWSKNFESSESHLNGDAQVRTALLLTVVGQFILGFLNWMLMAPTAMQLLHLFLADVTFMVLWWSGLVHETRESRQST